MKTKLTVLVVLNCQRSRFFLDSFLDSTRSWHFLAQNCRESYHFSVPITSGSSLPEYSWCFFLCSLLALVIPLGKEYMVYSTYNHTVKLKLTSFISEPFPLKFDSGDPGKQLLLKKNRLHEHFLSAKMQCHTAVQPDLLGLRLLFSLNVSLCHPPSKSQGETLSCLNSVAKPPLTWIMSRFHPGNISALQERSKLLQT